MFGMGIRRKKMIYIQNYLDWIEPKLFPPELFAPRKVNLGVGFGPAGVKREGKDRDGDVPPQSRAMLCAHMDGSFCKVINHIIRNGYMSCYHCGDCDSFKLKCDIK
jgi:hypothetical protein